MSQHLRPLTPGRSPADAFGAELRRLRIDHGLSQAGLGKLIFHSGALVGKIEKAERLPTTDFCARADAALATGGTLARMCPDRSPDGEPRGRIERRQWRAEWLTAVLDAAGLALDAGDRARVAHVVAQGTRTIRIVDGWISRAVEHAGQDPRAGRGTVAAVHSAGCAGRCRAPGEVA